MGETPLEIATDGKIDETRFLEALEKVNRLHGKNLEKTL